MSKTGDDSLIVEMIAQAALEGDTARALYLHDCWMVNFSEAEKANLKEFYGDDYEALLEPEKISVQSPN